MVRCNINGDHEMVTAWSHEGQEHLLLKGSYGDYLVVAFDSSRQWYYLEQIF